MVVASAVDQLIGLAAGVERVVILAIVDREAALRAGDGVVVGAARQDDGDDEAGERPPLQLRDADARRRRAVGPVDPREEHRLSDVGRATRAGSATGHAVGVDGCRGGWVAVWVEEAVLQARFHEGFAEVVAAHPHAACIAVDIPIGLSIAGPRACDKAARAVLGPRSSSVFPAPDPRLLGEADFTAVNERSKSLTGKGVSVQAFGIFPKVAEVGELMTPLAQNWIVEVHPEVCFWAMASGRPITHAKSTPAGYDERRALLGEALGVRLPAKADARDLVRGAGPDDVLDAAAACWTARRAGAGVAGRLPEEPELDRRGLRMEMVY